MSASSGPRVRYSILQLQQEYDSGNKKPLEDLVRAWKGIKELPPTDKRSFFVIGGYHGEPFQYRTDVENYWGGYCNHGNILFPTWHRVYVLHLEQALQSIVPDVTMPYWDETDDYTLQHGIPAILTQETFELDGETIPNPLRSFTLPDGLSDDIPDDDKAYIKPSGYTTVRYPLSGLVGTPAARLATKRHNLKYPHPQQNTEYLNENIKAWLSGPMPMKPAPTTQTGIHQLFQNCLQAPNYTVFSNTTSKSKWNNDNPGALVTALESPHNDIHLAVGGFEMPDPNKPGTWDQDGILADANGDMGENNTAAMDPIFFFHHCNIDRVFWLWQKQHGSTDQLDVIAGYPGTNSSDSQGPTPGIAPDTELSLDTPLNPFVKDESGAIYTSRDCVNIETQLGYTYAPGSLEQAPTLMAEARGLNTRKLTAAGIDRSLFQGSFVLHAYARVKGADGQTTEQYLGHESVLSRWNVINCANCLNHLEVIAHFPLHQLPDDVIDQAEYRLQIQHRGTLKLPAAERSDAIALVPDAAVALARSPELPEGLHYTLKVKA